VRVDGSRTHVDQIGLACFGSPLAQPDFEARGPAVIPLVAANALAVTIHGLPHVGHERLLLD
jgi:hypothetical protein